MRQGGERSIADLWAERTIRGMAGEVSPRPALLEAPEASVFTCEGTVRTVRFEGVTVMLGTYCSCTPDSRVAVAWQV